MGSEGIFVLVGGAADRATVSASLRPTRANKAQSVQGVQLVRRGRRCLPRPVGRGRGVHGSRAPNALLQHLHLGHLGRRRELLPDVWHDLVLAAAAAAALAAPLACGPARAPTVEGGTLFPRVVAEGSKLPLLGSLGVVAGPCAPAREEVGGALLLQVAPPQPVSADARRVSRWPVWGSAAAALRRGEAVGGRIGGGGAQGGRPGASLLRRTGPHAVGTVEAHLLLPGVRVRLQRGRVPGGRRRGLYAGLLQLRLLPRLGLLALFGLPLDACNGRLAVPRHQLSPVGVHGAHLVLGPEELLLCPVHGLHAALGPRRARQALHRLHGALVQVAQMRQRVDQPLAVVLHVANTWIPMVAQHLQSVDHLGPEFDHARLGLNFIV
mmetsp:Transcript_76584/g.205485  ORF Transcript_76584/g.205485 Transcript_76584/m.205485 type:complete len:381 (+) Transcript_76584:2-1144(+)